MANPKDDLFLLIHSMSKAEKRYFKLSSSFQGGNKSYLRLFDVIEKQKEYDEERIRKKFSGEAFAQKLSSYKHYLFNLILETLSANVINKTEYNRIRHRINLARVMYGRVRGERVLKELNSLEETAEDNEELELLYEIYYLKMNYFSSQYREKDGRDNLKKIYEQMSDNMQKHQNLSGYRQLMHEVIFLHTDIATLRTDEERKLWKEKFSTPLLKDINNALSDKARLIFYEANYIQHYKRYDLEKAYHCLMEQIKIVEKKPLLRRLSTLFNKCECEILLKRFPEARQTLLHLKSSKMNQINYDSLVCMYELQLYISMGDFAKTKTVFEEYEKAQGYSIHSTPSSIKLSILFLGAVMHFGNNNLSGAKKLLTAIFNDNEIAQTTDVNQYTSRIMYLIVLYELGDLEYLSHRVLSVYRYLVKHKRVYAIENILLAFLRREIKANEPGNNMNTKLKQLRMEMEKAISENPSEKIMFEYFDFISWIDSKIQKRSFSEFMREKANDC